MYARTEVSGLRKSWEIPAKSSLRLCSSAADCSEAVSSRFVMSLNASKTGLNSSLRS